jgi:hypothetical protein
MLQFPTGARDSLDRPIHLPMKITNGLQTPRLSEQGNVQNPSFRRMADMNYSTRS